ncbi:MAG TPA: amino acid permease [Thermoanaerobaculia bacterium]|jgi:amino acid transporter|nr:amino acid permease [Thermoanaerobaculia bacterium]
MDDQHDSDEAYLASLGYAQQLFREMGGFSNFAISFSIISILTGAVLLYGYGLKFAGPLANSVGWPLVSVFTLAVAASMAEIASAYPTAGGLYFWSSRLGGRGWGWTTAWLNMIGQVTITAGINIAAAIYLIGATTHLLGMPPDTGTNWYFQVAIMVVIMIPQVLINLYGIRLTARLSDISVWWHVAGGGLIVVALAFAGRHHNTLAFLFSFRPTGAAEVAKWYGAAPAALLFVLSLLQAQWTYTGYDASAHVAEETKMARLNSAWGIFLSVAVSAVFGYVMLLVLTWCIPNGDVAATAADPYPVLYIVAKNLTPVLTNVIAILIGGAMWLCGLASVTSMGRMWYAFARDDGMPGSSLLKRVSGVHRIPAWAIVVTSILSVLVCLYAAAFNVVTSISTIALYLAYVIPIWLNFRNRLTGRGEWMTRAVAPWSLGRFAPFINGVAIVWVVLITVIFMLPPNQLVFWTMLGLSAFMLIWWLVSARRGR